MHRHALYHHQKFSDSSRRWSWLKIACALLGTQALLVGMSSEQQHQWPLWRTLHFFPLLLTFSNTITLVRASKRGFAFVGDTHVPDNHLLSSANSPLNWYYNWGPYLNSDLISTDTLEFVPMIHGIDATQDSHTETVIRHLPQSSTHLLSFNEPGGTKESSGSEIDPKDAASEYMNYVVPFRNGTKGGRKWEISHPSTTGSPKGLDWLRDFNTSCFEIDAQNGCPADFVAVHWYGAFDGLAAWIARLDAFYNGNSDGQTPLKLWVTELGLPQQSAEDTIGMMEQALPYLDGLDYIERYAWFGAFRTGDANEWTGNGVALFDSNGGLTKLGALYMGDSFQQGQKGPGNHAEPGLQVGVSLLVALSICSVVVLICS